MNLRLIVAIGGREKRTAAEDSGSYNGSADKPSVVSVSIFRRQIPVRLSSLS
jgi:hypothetical protein